MKNFTERQELALRRAALRFGESLMPWDCAAIIQLRYRRSIDAIGICNIARMIMTMMDCAGYLCDARDAVAEAATLHNTPSRA